MTKTVRVVIRNETNSGNRKGWTKWVQSVDTTKTDGYAFIGPFLNDGEIDLPVGAVLIEKTPEGTAKHSWYGGVCRVVREDGSYEMNHDKCFTWKEKFLSFRDHVAKTLFDQMELSKAGDLDPREYPLPEDAHREKVLRVIGLMEELEVTLKDLQGLDEEK